MSRDRFALTLALLDYYAAPYSGRLLRFVANIERARQLRGIPSLIS